MDRQLLCDRCSLAPAETTKMAGRRRNEMAESLVMAIKEQPQWVVLRYHEACPSIGSITLIIEIVSQRSDHKIKGWKSKLTLLKCQRSMPPGKYQCELPFPHF